MNTTQSFFAGVTLLAATFCSSLSTRADSGTNPNFSEVRELLLKHMSGGTEAELNRAAVAGLIAELKGRAELLSDHPAVKPSTNALAGAAQRFDGEVGYVRIHRVAEGLAKEVAQSIAQLKTSNTLAGLVLDLRYADGTDYASAAATVDLFLAQEVPLLNAGKGLVSSKEKTNALVMPVVALVNGQTKAAAEALAAVLRQAGVGLLIGSPTAGRAGITSDYQLSTGQMLRVVTAPVQLGNAQALTVEGVAPDVTVDVKAEDELKFYADPFAGAGRVASTVVSAESKADSARRVRVTEADLVREKRGDGDLETVAGERVKSEPAKPKVNDPVLSRAIDLLKGLAVVRQWKS